MIDSISIASSGLSAQQGVIDSISNNLANINTNSYKRSIVSFSSLVYEPAATTDSLIDLSTRKGGGISSSKIEREFSMGDIKQTGKALDIAINGSGFIELVDENGDAIYTRNGSLKINSDGFITSQDGLLLSSMISVPDKTESLIITEKGVVLAVSDGGVETQEIGKIEIVTFTNPSALEPLNGQNYLVADLSGQPQYVDLENTSTSIAQGYLEMSNVNMIDELTSMMLAKQAYGLNSRVVQTSDEIMGMINNLTQG